MIKIGKRSPIQPTTALWPEEESQLQAIDMAELFEDSPLQKMYFRKQAVTDIAEWIALSEREKKQQPETVVEKGGILLGTYRSLEQTYETLIHTFAPIEQVDFQSNTLWRVDRGIAPAILTANEKYGDQLVVGWLHTHPGHGPYLSMTDLEQTQLFFPHPYQVAIVIDSLVESQPSGLFTRQLAGNMNNAEHQQHWLSWQSFATT